MAALNFKTNMLASLLGLLAFNCPAAEIQEGTTGYAAKIVNGQEVIIAQTLKHGLVPAVSSDPGFADMSDDFLTFNPGTVAKISLDRKTFVNSQTGDSIPLNLLGNQLNAKVLETVNHDNGDVSWIAASGDQENAVITFGADGSIVGSVLVKGVKYSISTDANGHTWIVNNTDSGQKAASLEHDQVIPAHTQTGAEAGLTADQAAANLAMANGNVFKTVIARGATNALNIGPVSTTDTSKNVANVLVYAANNMPGYQTVVNFLIATTNQAYVNSGVNLKLKLTGIIPVADPFPNNDINELYALYGATDAFKNIGSDRANAQADFVVMVHPFQHAQGMCGISYINGYAGSRYYKALTVAAVSYGSQGNEYCHDWTFAHELGHSMGMVHDAGDGGSAKIGHYTDAMGFGLKNVYGDIMSYYPQVGLFSSPDLFWAYNASTKYPLGQLGVANVVRGINVAAPQIINFHNLPY